jgi:hypothetical protein
VHSSLAHFPCCFFVPFIASVADGTGALRIYNFEPDSITDFLNVVQVGLTTHQHKYNGTSLIIDLRANGGGDICLGYATLRFIFPQLALPLYALNAAEDSPFGIYDTIQAPMTRYLADKGLINQLEYPLNNTCDFFTPCGWLRPDTQTQYTDESWYVPQPARMLQRGSTIPKAYTSLFHDSCSNYFDMLAPSGINNGYSADNVALVAGGMCGSTCSVFSSFIQFNSLAKTVALGGIVDTNVVVGSIPMQVRYKDVQIQKGILPIFQPG